MSYLTVMLFCVFSFVLHQITILEKFLKVILQRVLVKLQTDKVFIQSLRNFHDELLIFRIYFFYNSTQCPEAAVNGCSAKGCSDRFHTNPGKKPVPDSFYFNTVASLRPVTY